MRRALLMGHVYSLDEHRDLDPVDVVAWWVEQARGPRGIVEYKSGSALYLDILERMDPSPKVQAIIDRLRAEEEVPNDE
jgi:hypothetical protein